MNAKQILLTGGAGFIGSHVAELLIGAGYEVCIVDDFSTGDKANIPTGARVIAGSIADPQCLEDAFANEPEAIIHLAAVVSIRNSFANFYNDGLVNIGGTLNLLRYAAKAGVKRFVFASSMAVYGPPANPLARLSERDICNPVSPYGVAKQTIERYLALLSGFYKIKCTCLRYFNTYGNQRGYSPYVGVINILIKKLLKGEPIEIFGDGTQERDFIHVRDVARATVSALANDEIFSICNVGTGTGTRILDLAQMICGQMGKSFEPFFSPAAPGEIHRAIADTLEAESKLRFRAELAIQSVLQEVIDWNIRQSAPDNK